MEKQDILQELAVVNLKLALIHKELIQKNKGDNQFDYTTSQELSHGADILEKWSTKINRIVYQQTE